MERVYGLSVYVRAALLTALIAAGLFLLFNIAPLVYSRKAKSAFAAYILSLFAALAVFAAAVTPLVFAKPNVYPGAPPPVSASDILSYVLLLPAVFAVVCGVKYKKPVYLIDAGALLLMLPFFSFWDGYPYTLLALVPYFLFRSAFIYFHAFESLKNAVSPYSVKFALDALDEGVLFAGGSGRIEFINGSMRSVIKDYAGGEYDKADVIWERLRGLAGTGGRVISGGSLLLNLGGRALMFTDKTVSHIPALREISFADVTEEENLLRQIEEINLSESERRDILRETLAAVEKVESEKEVLRLKSRLHDAISQRLSILHKFLESIEPQKDLKKIKALIVSMLPDILEGAVCGNIRERLDGLAASYNLIGVDLIIEGELPDDGKCGETLFETVRECSANAVRHGGASEIRVRITGGGGGAPSAEKPARYKICIVNNGLPPSEITEGNGLTVLRRLISGSGGALDISLSPDFSVNVVL